MPQLHKHFNVSRNYIQCCMNKLFYIVLFLALISCGRKKKNLDNLNGYTTGIKFNPHKGRNDTSHCEVSNLFENKVLKLTSACFYQFNDSINKKLQQAIGDSDYELLQNFEISENTPLVFQNRNDTIVVNFFFINHPDNNQFATKIKFFADTVYLYLQPKGNYNPQFAHNVNRFTWEFIRKNENNNLKFILQQNIEF